MQIRRAGAEVEMWEEKDRDEEEATGWRWGSVGTVLVCRGSPRHLQMGMVVHTYNHSTQEVGGQPGVQGHPQLLRVFN